MELNSQQLKRLSEVFGNLSVGFFVAAFIGPGASFGLPILENFFLLTKYLTLAILFLLISLKLMKD